MSRIQPVIITSYVKPGFEPPFGGASPALTTAIEQQLKPLTHVGGARGGTLPQYFPDPAISTRDGYEDGVKTIQVVFTPTDSSPEAYVAAVNTATLWNTGVLGWGSFWEGQGLTPWRPPESQIHPKFTPLGPPTARAVQGAQRIDTKISVPVVDGKLPVRVVHVEYGALFADRGSNYAPAFNKVVASVKRPDLDEPILIDSIRDFEHATECLPPGAHVELGLRPIEDSFDAPTALWRQKDRFNRDHPDPAGWAARRG
jgi:hypothetical protein